MGCAAKLALLLSFVYLVSADHYATLGIGCLFSQARTTQSGIVHHSFMCLILCGSKDQRQRPFSCILIPELSRRIEDTSALACEAKSVY